MTAKRPGKPARGTATGRPIMVLLDVLAREVGVLGVFSDWPATVTYYANCMGL